MAGSEKKKPLQNRYRPDNLGKVAGNLNTIDSIRKVVGREDPPKSYLITGPAGCGKTTLAYIIRDMLGCTPSAFHEFDASADRGIDKIRKIKEESQLLPMTGDVMVMFFDECHQITAAAQEAMLKLLENPPEHVYLILATTEMSKLKPTVVRRCTQFAVDRLNRTQMVHLLMDICEKEGKPKGKALLSKIFKVSWGSPGQAVKLLDQVIDMKDEKLAEESLENVTFDENTAFMLCKVLSSRSMTGIDKWNKSREMLKTFKGSAEDARLTILSYFEKILIDSGDFKVATIMTNFVDSVMYTGRSGLSLCVYFACQYFIKLENKKKGNKD